MGYYQIPVRAMNIPKIAVITPFGLSEFLCTLFGIVQCFQKFTGVFDRLEQHGLFIHPGRCVFGVTEITFLGHGVNTEGIKPTPTNHLRFILPDSNQGIPGLPKSDYLL